jgi:RNA polymerase sigma-70 factor (ECF subfamily)
LPDMPDSVDERNRFASDDDAGSVARCRRGDAEAFASLVRKHQKRMINIACRMTGDYDEACDVVQESFLSAWRAIGKFRGDARFSTWLTGIVLNHARNQLSQRASRSRREGVSLDSPNSTVNAKFGDGLRSQDASPADRLERTETAAKIQECLGTLDGEQREVIVLRDIQGFSYEEIGAMLKVPDGTVKSRLYRARNTLKDCLRPLFGDLK